jgi:hypothetical protein
VSQRINWDAQTAPDPRAMILAEGVNGSSPHPADPKTLPLAELYTAPRVFQMRHALISLTRQPQTVAALWQLIRQGVTLDPMAVWWSGSRWVVLDGHHRLEAYLADATDKAIPKGAYSVPVAAFAGTLSEAQVKAGQENAKVRNPTSGPEKQEWAWRLYVSGSESSPTVLARATGISRLQVYRMRDRKAELETLGMTPETMIERGWHSCRHDEGKRMMDPEDVEAFKAKMEETADRLVKALVKEFGGTWHRNAPAFAYTFATRAPQFAKMLVDSEALWPLVQEVQRVEWEGEAEEAAELVDRVRRNSANTLDDPLTPF